MTKRISKNLRHQIKFLENVKLMEIDQDDWQEKVITYASITPICDMSVDTIENFNFGHVMTEALFLFKIRFIPEINIKMRIWFNHRQFEIKRIINPFERHQFLNIIALEI